MKRIPINKTDVAIIAATVMTIILAIFISLNRYVPVTHEPPCYLRAQVVVTAPIDPAINEIIIVQAYVIYGRLDGLFVKVWSNDSRPPDALTSGICYMDGADGIRRVNSDDLTLYTGQSIICYFNLTQANEGIPLVKGKTYYYTVYGKSCYIIYQLAKGIVGAIYDNDSYNLTRIDTT